MMELVIGIPVFPARWVIPVRAQIELIHSTFEDHLNGLSKCCLGGYERLATLILAPKGAMVTRFPEAKTVVGHLDLYYK